MRTSISERVSQRRPQPLRAEILIKSCPKLVQTVHVSIMTELHFNVRVKRSGRPSEEGSAMTRTARRPARCAVRDQCRVQHAKVKEETLDLAVVRTASSAIFWTLLCSGPVSQSCERNAKGSLLGQSSRCTQPPFQFGPADAFARRRRGGKSSRSRGAWSSHRAARSVGGSHSLRVSSVHHDRCRPEVAVA